MGLDAPFIGLGQAAMGLDPGWTWLPWGAARQTGL